MIEPNVVDTPAHFPQMCLCGSQKRPIADTGIETEGGRRVYICVDCAKLLARAYGFTKGPELDKLVNAGAEIQAVRDEMVGQRKIQVELEEEVRRLSTEKAIMEEERDLALGEAAQLKHIAAAIESASAEMMGARA